MEKMLTFPVQPVEETPQSSKLLYEELSARKEKAEKKLIRNVIVQIGVILLGVSYTYQFEQRIVELLAFLSGIPAGNIPKDGQIIRLIIPMLMIYLFIEFGFAMAQYFILHKFFKRFYKQLVRKYSVSDDGIEIGMNERDLDISLNPLNIFGQLAGGNVTTQGKAQTLIAQLIIGAVIVGNHITTFRTMEVAYNDDGRLLFIYKLAACALLTTFYIIYFTSNRINQHSPKVPTNVVIIAGFILAVWFTFFR